MFVVVGSLDFLFVFIALDVLNLNHGIHLDNPGSFIGRRCNNCSSCGAWGRAKINWKVTISDFSSAYSMTFLLCSYMSFRKLE
jgi:hypothetical protein